MKKFFLMVALAATALFTTTACGEEDEVKTSNSGETADTLVVLSKPRFKNYARVVDFIDANDYGIKQVRFMESGGYMVARKPGETEARATRASDFSNCIFEFGKYKYDEGIYKFENGMVFTFAEKSNNIYDVTITWPEGTSITTLGTFNTSDAVTPGVMTDNLISRIWTVEKVRVIGVVDGIKLAKDFWGPINLADVKAWYEEKFGTLKDQFAANTIIEGIYFDGNGLFAINYKNRTDDIGRWRWSNMEDGKLIYNWTNPEVAISLFSGDATVEFTQDPETCKMTLKGNVNNYDLEFQFMMK